MSRPMPPPNPSSPISTAAILKICGDPNRFNIVTMALRPGSLIFSVRLEFEHFTPDTPRNKEYLLFEHTWEDTFWSTISIPKEDRHLAELIAKEEKMRLADGIPTLILPGRRARFPVDTPNTFTLENAADHPCHDKGFNLREWQAKELDRAEEISSAHWVNYQESLKKK